jgi:ankyrin repeat protein
LACKYFNNNELNIVKLLLDSGANINFRSNGGWFPLLFAVHNGYMNLVKLLVDNGANINMQNDDGWSSLIAASQESSRHSSFKIVKFLIDNGANVNTQNAGGITALIQASHYSNIYSSLDTVALLVDSGADINLRDSINGETALMQASRESDRYSSFNTVDLLIKRGANINLRNNYGKSALDLCAEALSFKKSDESASNMKTFKLLLSGGANICKIKYGMSFKNIFLQFGAENDIDVDNKNSVACVKCCKNKAVYLIKPCNHVLYCNSCIYDVTNCCLRCNSSVIGHVRLFF